MLRQPKVLLTPQPQVSSFIAILLNKSVRHSVTHSHICNGGVAFTIYVHDSVERLYQLLTFYYLNTLLQYSKFYLLFDRRLAHLYTFNVLHGANIVNLFSSRDWTKENLFLDSNLKVSQVN